MSDTNLDTSRLKGDIWRDITSGDTYSARGRILQLCEWCIERQDESINDDLLDMEVACTIIEAVSLVDTQGQIDEIEEQLKNSAPNLYLQLRPQMRVAHLRLKGAMAA